MKQPLALLRFITSYLFSRALKRPISQRVYIVQRNGDPDTICHLSVAGSVDYIY